LEKFDKLIIADEMLESAIEEFLDKRRFFAALNLAGVAQEIYGKQIRIMGRVDTMSRVAIDSHSIYIKDNTKEAKLKEFKDISTNTKNSIKHFDSENDRFLELDPIKEARLMIAVAIYDKAVLNRAILPMEDRFKEFATIYHWHNLPKK
jgi:hypothetical protein